MYVKVRAPWALDAMSKLSPITIGAQAMLLGVPLVLHRGDLSEETEIEEAVHIYQQVECAVVSVVFTSPLYFLVGWWAVVATVLCVAPYGIGFWSIYLASYLVNKYHSGMSGPEAYENIVFEVEAHGEGVDRVYLKTRPVFAWARR